MSSSTSQINVTPENSMSFLKSIRLRIKKLPGGKLLFSAVVLMLTGIAVEQIAATDAQFKRQSGTMELGCEARIEGQTVQLAIGGSITNRGRDITCRNYDGHPVLVYTTLDN